MASKRVLRPLAQAGFTLLETLIAITILMMALGAIFAMQGSSMATSIRTRQTNIVSMLVKNAMIQTEYEIEGKTFEEIPKDKDFTFPQPFQDYSWSRSIKEVEFPDIMSVIATAGGQGNESGGGGGGGSGGGGGGDQMTDMLSQLVTKFLSKSIREVVLTVKWRKGKSTQQYTISTYWVNLNNGFDLSM